jgi:hypothetical protein
MEFKEFLENEEAKLFDVGLEQMDEVLGTALKFAGGLGGNLISQTGRGLGNLATGLGQSAIGTGQGALSALQAAGGGWNKKGKKTFDSAYSNLEAGGRKLGRGVAQLAGALSGTTPLLRGAQATSEPMRLSGVYAPSSKNRTKTQDLFGLNSWEKPPIVQKQNVSRKNYSPEEIKTRSFLKDLSRQERGLIPQPEEWKKLVSMYKIAKTSEERKTIRRKMREVSPQLYQQAVERGARQQKTRV